MKYPTTLCGTATVGTIRGDNSIGYAKLRTGHIHTLIRFWMMLPKWSGRRLLYGRNFKE